MGTFTVGTAKLDMTPHLGCHLVGYFGDRIATNIHDPLYVKAIAIHDGEHEIGLMTLDVMDMPQEIITEAKKLITERTGLPAEDVLISSTHTHTGPATTACLSVPQETEYTKGLVIRIADCFVLAHNSRVPAEIAHTSGDAKEEVHNRDWLMKDGTTRMNPGYLNPDAIRPAGPTDPELGLLIIREPDTRKPIALYANLALHYVGSDQGLWVSADYFGYFASAMQRLAGEDFLVIMANGCQGNINNYDFTRPRRTSTGPYHQCERVANVLAAEAWKQWNLLREEDFLDEGTVGASLEMLPFHSRTATPEEYAKAEQDYFHRPEGMSNADWIYAYELYELQKLPVDYEVPVHALHINDLALVGLHGEVFVEFGLDVKSRSPFSRTMVIGLANGSTGYISTDHVMDGGSYETRLCRHVRAPKGTGKLWTDTAIRLLNGLKDSVQ